MEVNYAVVEAFTIGDNQGFTGNPAAVVFLETDDQIPDDVKQKIANTMNLSETAFVSRAWTAEDLSGNPGDDQDSKVIRRTLRWFTPKNEVPLCGHATLASARALRNALGDAVEKIEFESKFRGILSASVESEDRFTLDFPANSLQPLTLEQDTWIGNFARDLLGDDFNGIEDVSDFQNCAKETTVLVRLKQRENEDPETTIHKVSPDFEKLKGAETGGTVVALAIVTIQARDRQSGESPHFYSRVFVPWFGIPEDPVTGMAHAILTPYWTEILGETLLYARQASKRKGDLRCKVVGERVEMSGRAKIFCNGILKV